MILLALFGCATSPDCDATSADVADTDTIGDFDFTAADVLATIAGTRLLPATSEGRVRSIELTIARGEGSAVLHDAEWAEDGEGNGLVRLAGSNQPFIICADEVDVPVDVRLRTLDGGLDLAMSTVATTQHAIDHDEAMQVVTVSGEVDPDASTFDPPLAAGTRPPLHLDFEDGRLTRLTMEWETDMMAHDLAWPPSEWPPLDP